MSTTLIPNRTFRRALLGLNGLAPPAKYDGLPRVTPRSGPAWARAMVRRLAFVQVDPISAVERAHHHILFSRNPRYRQEWLCTALEQDRTLFENWTHDAAILPVESYPYWKHFFRRQKNYEIHPGYRRYFGMVGPADRAKIFRRIKKEGPLGSRDFDTNHKVKTRDATFPALSVAKVAMEYLWRIGKLAVERRESRNKIYDLAERVIPSKPYAEKVSKAEYVDWACTESLKRLGAATPTQIARFLDAVSKQEAEAWCRRRLGRDVVEVRVAHSDGSSSASLLALESWVDGLRAVPAAPKPLRLINPFDPLIHDRQRTQRVFGFDYAIEIWVPPAKRKYGYYVLPILEGERFTGRVDAKVDRKADCLNVLGLWWEPGVRSTRSRASALERELHRLARFAGVRDIAPTPTEQRG